MTEAKTTFRGLRGVAAAAGALLALAGCAGTNVGSEWQCPMAQGKACVSIAGADPAIMKPAAGTVTIRKPLHESRVAAVPASGPIDRNGWSREGQQGLPRDLQPVLLARGVVRGAGSRGGRCPVGCGAACGSGRVRAGGRTRHRSGGAARRTRRSGPWRRRSADLATIYGPERSSGASGSRPSSMPRAFTARPAGRGW